MLQLLNLLTLDHKTVTRDARTMEVHETDDLIKQLGRLIELLEEREFTAWDIYSLKVVLTEESNHLEVVYHVKEED